MRTAGLSRAFPLLPANKDPRGRAP